MVDTKVDEPTQIQDGEAMVVPPRLEVHSRHADMPAVHPRQVVDQNSHGKGKMTKHE